MPTYSSLLFSVVLAPMMAAAASGPSSGATRPMTATIAIEERSIGDLGKDLAAGTVTSRDLVAAYLARIEMLDRQGPAVSAVIELNPDALEVADALDRERLESGARGPLHGIPILIKDNIDTADRMQTTAGSLALVDSRPEQDAFVVTRLRAAGVVILGKTNLSEWANFRSTKSNSGWSGRGGQTRNPYALDRSPSGSSSGSAVAVAASLSAAAVGTETDGSIVSPASVCGIVGIKPTVGLISRTGIIPIAHSQDTAGPMARSVADAALLLGAMTGVDPRDPASGASTAHARSDYASLLDRNGLADKRLGVLRSKAFHLGSKTDLVLDSAIAAIKRAGGTVVEVEFKSPANNGPANSVAANIDDCELEVLLYEFKTDLDAYLAARPKAKVKSLLQLIAFNREHAASELRFFGQELLEMAVKKGPLSDDAYIQAAKTCGELARANGIDAVMDENRLDALIAVSNGPAHLIDLVNGDAYTGGSSTPAAVAGYPSITVPAGDVMGLPVGLSLFGRAWSEPELIRMAYAFEQATKARTPPRYLATLPLTGSAKK